MIASRSLHRNRGKKFVKYWYKNTYDFIRRMAKHGYEFSIEKGSDGQAKIVAWAYTPRSQAVVQKQGTPYTVNFALQLIEDFGVKEKLPF